MKKTVTTSVALPRIVHEAFKEYADARGEKMSTILQGWIANAVGIPIKTDKETIAQKIDELKGMESVFPLTKGKFPSHKTFYNAFRESRIQYREDGSVLLYSAQKSKCYCFVPRTQD